jgi:hypothetical protein
LAPLVGLLLKPPTGAPDNQRMKLTGAAILVSRGMLVLQAAPAAYPYRYAADMGDVFRWLCGGLALLALGVFALFGVLDFLARFLIYREEKRLRHKLTLVNRFITWAEVEAKFSAGTGTLVVEHRGPKGPIREWWTEEDVIAASPVSLPASLKSPPNEAEIEPHKQYSKLCATRYVDLEAGGAKATEVPVPLLRRLDPRKYMVVDLGGGLMTAVVLKSGRKLAEKYPQGKVVTLLAWSEEPLLFLGDAESVFLKEAEASVPPSGAV